MDFRLASLADLPKVREMYRQIIRDMDEKGIQIWDEVYPCEFFEEDIRRSRLYVLTRSGEIVSALALCDSSPGEGAIGWKKPDGQALYIDRLGVNVEYQGKGVGSLTLERAGEMARTLGAECLRLFVVDCNMPSIRLYEKNGFARAAGFYDEVIDEDLVLREYGYERKLIESKKDR